LLDSYDLGMHTSLESVSFRNATILATANPEIKLFSLETGKPLYTLICLDSLDYLCLTPAGYFKTTPGAAKMLHYVTKDLKVITFEQLDVKYNRPDKVLEAAGSADSLLIKSYRKAWEKRIKKLGVDTSRFREGYSVPEADFMNRDEIGPEQSTGKLTLHLQGSDTAFILDRFNIWVNETPLYGQRGIRIGRRRKNNFDTTITIQLSQGENKIETSVANINGTESYRMPLAVTYRPELKEKEMVHFIGIGIDRFADSEYNLQYSRKDIRDLAGD
jgi:hypothetical protein